MGKISLARVDFRLIHGQIVTKWRPVTGINKIVVIDSGRLVTVGTPKEVFSRKDELRAVGLDLPPVTEFTESLREKGIDLSATILDVEQAAEEIAAYLKKKSEGGSR